MIRRPRLKKHWLKGEVQLRAYAGALRGLFTPVISTSRGYHSYIDIDQLQVRSGLRQLELALLSPSVSRIKSLQRSCKMEFLNYLQISLITIHSKKYIALST